MFGKKLQIPFWKNLVTVLIVYPIAVFWMFVLFWVDTGFTSWGGNNIVRVFVYVPLIGIPVAKLLRIDQNKMLSLLSFGPLLVHGISHFGCIFGGCCKGYPNSWGIYNHIYEDIRFPIQPIEALAAVAIVVYLICRAKKRKYVPDGYEYPLMLVLFGSSRFIFEFFRDNGKLFWGISLLAVHAFIMFVVGVIWISVRKRKCKSIESTT